MWIIFLLVFLISSCSFSLPTTLTCTLMDNHPYEQASGKLMWYRIVYFDGKEVKSFISPEGRRKIKITVYPGGLRPVIAIPLDRLSPIGGYYEEGGDKNILLFSENGSFLQMLLEVASERPGVVSNLSLNWLDDLGYDFGTIDQNLFVKNLYDGTLNKENIKNAPFFHPKIDTLSDGYWISDSVKAPSFYFHDADSITLHLFAGVYNFWNQKKDMLFTLIISEDGRVYSKMGKLPELY